MDTIVKAIKDFVQSIKDIKEPAKRFTSLSSVLIIVFVVLPMILNFLAISELKNQAELLQKISNIDINNLDNASKEKYEVLVENVNNNHLPYNRIKKSFEHNVGRLFDQGSVAWKEHVSSNVSFIGFGYKADIFRFIFNWQLKSLIVFVIIALIISLGVFSDYKALKRILFSVLTTVGFLILFLLFSLLAGWLISFNTFLMIVSEHVTKWISVILLWIIEIVLTIWGIAEACDY